MVHSNVYTCLCQQEGKMLMHHVGLSMSCCSFDFPLEIAFLLIIYQIEAEDLPELSEKYDIAFVPVFVLMKVCFFGS